MSSPDDVTPFGTRLAAAVADRGPLCVGIDPHRSLLLDWGVGDDLDGLRRFTDAVVDALAGSVALLKPQMAFYERFGARGVAVLEDAVARIRAAGRPGAARRQARRHRLHDGRLRGLPVARPPDAGRRPDREPLPRARSR